MAPEGSQGMSQWGMHQPSGSYASGLVACMRAVVTTQGSAHQSGTRVRCPKSTDSSLGGMTAGALALQLAGLVRLPMSLVSAGLVETSGSLRMSVLAA